MAEKHRSSRYENEVGLLSEEAEEFLTTKIHPHEFKSKKRHPEDYDDEYLPLDVIFKPW